MTTKHLLSSFITGDSMIHIFCVIYTLLWHTMWFMKDSFVVVIASSSGGVHSFRYRSKCFASTIHLFLQILWRKLSKNWTKENTMKVISNCEMFCSTKHRNNGLKFGEKRYGSYCNFWDFIFPTCYLIRRDRPLPINIIKMTPNFWAHKNGCPKLFKFVEMTFCLRYQSFLS